MAVYLDCNATAPVEPAVSEAVIRFMTEEYGNAGSRTHEYGAKAKQAVQQARDSVAALVSAERDEVVFTSGATESDNLAILGLAQYGTENDRKHIVSTMIEHKAILEPLEALARTGFDVTLVPPTSGGWVDPDAIKKALRKDTLLVSMMHVNNETGVIQAISEVAAILSDHPAFFHVDAAQGFGKDIAPLRNSRIDLISVSGHKIYAPKGVGALITRRRGYQRPPLKPLIYGGGQERGLRPGTLPVPLIVGLGVAAELSAQQLQQRTTYCLDFRRKALDALMPLEPNFNGDANRTLPHVLNLSFDGIDSEALMVALKAVIAVSNGSACTSSSYQPSHVLQAMGLSKTAIQGAIRLSWCHLTEEPAWEEVVEIIKALR